MNDLKLILYGYTFHGNLYLTKIHKIRSSLTWRHSKKCKICVTRVTRNGLSGTRAVLIKIFMLCWNLPSGPKHQGWLQKNIAFPEGNKQFCWDFVLIWMKQSLIWLNLQRDGTRNGLSNIKETFEENLQLQMSVLH